jgi:hypothetical protein
LWLRDEKKWPHLAQLDVSREDGGKIYLLLLGLGEESEVARPVFHLLMVTIVPVPLKEGYVVLC